MMRTVVDEDGTVRCPMCRATSFTSKRTATGVVALGVVAPKRLRCNGCGRNLMPALPDYKAERERRHQANLAMPEGSRLRKAAERNDAKTLSKSVAKAAKKDAKPKWTKEDPHPKSIQAWMNRRAERKTAEADGQ